jgi:uncharacterized RDD family membrane protein YckC
MTAGEPTMPSELKAPSLRRRLACWIYEGVLLFGVLMISGYLFSALTQQRHALQGRHGLQAFLFVVLAIYFVWFWSHGGQTVAMKAWQIRLVDKAGQPVTERRALARYLLSWLWFVPALLALSSAGVRDVRVTAAMLLAGVVVYAVLARLHGSRQFLHDVIAGTRLVTVTPPG